MGLNIFGLLLYLLLQESLCNIESHSSPLLSTSREEEVITIQNGNEVLCVSNDRTSPMFVTPLKVQKAAEPSQTLLDLAGVDAWNVRNLEDSSYKSIIDKRWEDFEVQFTDYMIFHIKRYFALSIFNQTSPLKLHLVEEQRIESFTFVANATESWEHIGVVVDGDELKVFRGDRLFGVISHFKPTRIVIMTHNKAFFKMHKYAFLHSDVPSQQPVDAPIPPETSCLVVYASMCSSCYLDFGDTHFSYKEGWRRKEIELKSSQRTLKIFRGSYANNETLYWELDIRECPKVHNDLVGVYSTLSTKQSQCFSLNSYQRDGNISYGVLHSSKCSPGLLGADCTIKCADLLGEENKYCPQSRICDNGNCYCSWGFQGQDCRQQCSEGEWGTDCQNRCSDNNCELCDGVTGECTRQSYASDIFEKISSAEIDWLKKEATKEVETYLDITGGIIIGMALGLALIGLTIGIVVLKRRFSIEAKKDNTNTSTKQYRHLINV